MALIVFDVSGTLHEDRMGAPMFDGLVHVFKSLKQNGVQIALATNLSRSGLNHFVENNKIAEYLDAHLSMSEAAAKPHPEMLDECILQTGEERASTLMVGDAPSDIYMAHSIKVKACAVAWDGFWHDSHLAEKPEYKVENIDQLCQILSDFTGKNINK